MKRLWVILLIIGCSGTKPEPEPKPQPNAKEIVNSKRPKKPDRTIKKNKYSLLTGLLKSKPDKQTHVFDIHIVDLNNNPITNVEFEADVELLGSIEDEELLDNITINKISDNSGNIVFEITHPITQTTSAFSTYTFVSYKIIKDDYIDKSGSLDIYHSEEVLTKDYLTEKILTKKITIFRASDFIHNSFNLYSKEAKITLSDLENCIETIILFPSSYGKLIIGSIKIIKDKEGLYLEFAFNSSIELIDSYKSIGRRIGSSLFVSNLQGVRMKNNRGAVSISSLDNINKLLKREISDAEFLLKITKG